MIEEKAPPKKKKQVLFKREHIQNHPHAKWLNTAIRSNRWGKDKNVTITYKKLNGDVVERKVKPVGTRGEHLIAHDYHRDAIRSFHVGRIEKMEKTAFFGGFADKARGVGNKAKEFAKVHALTGIGAIAGGVQGGVLGGTVQGTLEDINEESEGKKYDRSGRTKRIWKGVGTGALLGGVLGGALTHATPENKQYRNYARARQNYERAGGGGAYTHGAGFSSQHASHLGFDKAMPKTKAEAKARYRHAARMNHPDLGGDVEKMKKINDAWDRFEKSPHFSKLAQMLFGRIQMENA